MAGLNDRPCLQISPVMNELEKLLNIVPQPVLETSWVMAMDEVGRGSLFGPVSVGGIIFKGSEFIDRTNHPWQDFVADSKKVKPALRNQLAIQIKESYYSHVSHVSVKFIEKYNINRAIQYGVYRVTHYLSSLVNARHTGSTISLILLDGNYRFEYPQLRMSRPMPRIHSIIKGDETVFHISCASIVAKVERDTLIQKSAERFPDYHLQKNAGYGTLAHRDAIQKNGLTAFHRKGFVKKIATI